MKKSKKALSSRLQQGNMLNWLFLSCFRDFSDKQDIRKKLEMIRKELKIPCQVDIIHVSWMNWFLIHSEL